MMRTAKSAGTKPCRVALALALGGLVSACGGGGGGNTRPDPPPAAPPPTPPAPSPPVVYAPNPAYSKHLEWTSTGSAQAAGLTGKGVVIGVVDSGVTSNHPALQGRVLGNLIYIDANGNNLAVDDVVGHGTAVSLAMAGKAFGAWPGGVAPGASIVSARIIADKRPTDDGSGEGNEVDGALGLAPIHADLIARGARIMNNSWGGLYWNNPAATAPIAGEYRPFIFSNNGLVVFATGNEGKANPSDMAALPSQLGSGGSLPAADLERGWLAVAALDESNRNALASYSNACGVAMNYCLAAPGTVITPGTSDTPSAPTYWQWSGTSLAAPVVSGAAALVWEAFPYFNNDLVRQTLLGTATDLGAAGVDPVFGYGSLNVGKAVLGPARFDWGDVSVSLAGVNSNWGNAISGNGGLNKQGGGKLSLTQVNSYLGDTRVQGGTLSSTFSVPGNALVSAGANLELLQGGVNGTLENHGTLTIMGSGRERRVGGNYLQSAGSVFSYQIGSPLMVAGSAQIAGELRVNGIASGYVRTARETVIRADAGLAGQFSSLSNGPGVFLTATLGYDPNSAWLDITRLDVTAASRALAGATAVSLGSAERIEQVFRKLDEQGGADSEGSAASADFMASAGQFQRVGNAEVAQASLDSLSGQLHAAADAVVFDSIALQQHALAAQLDSWRDEPGQRGGWYQSLAGSAGASNAGFQLDGWMLGQDYRLSQGLRAGIAVAQINAHSMARGRFDRSRDRQTQGQVYLASLHGPAYLLGQLGAGHYQRQVHREVLLGERYQGVDTEYPGDYMSGSIEAGYRWGQAGSSLTPYLGVNHVDLSRGDFIENGASGFGLRTHDSEATQAQAVLGLRGNKSFHWGRATWSLQMYAEWQQRLATQGESFAASFVGVETWSPLIDGADDRETGLFGWQLRADFNQRSRLVLGYDQRWGLPSPSPRVSARWVVGF